MSPSDRAGVFLLLRFVPSPSLVDVEGYDDVWEASRFVVVRAPGKFASVYGGAAQRKGEERSDSVFIVLLKADVKEELADGQGLIGVPSSKKPLVSGVSCFTFATIFLGRVIRFGFWGCWVGMGT